MKFFKWEVFKKSATIPTSVTNSEILNFIKHGGYERISPHEAYKMYESIGALGDAVDMIATKFADMKPIIVDEDGQVVEVPEVEKFFASPNEFESYNEFALNLGTNFMIQSNAILQVIGFNKGKPQAIYNVPSDKITVSTGNNVSTYQVNITGLYQFLTGTFKISSDQPRILDSSNLKELYHIRSFNQNTDSLTSVSKLSSIKKEMQIIDQSLVKMRSLLVNGFSAAGLASIRTNDLEVYDRFKKDLNDLYSGGGNSGRIIATVGDSIDLKPFEQSNRDLQTLENKTDSKKMIYSRFEIPQPLIDQASQTYNNYQTALYSLYDNAVIPMAKKVFQKMTKIFRDRNMLTDQQMITFDHSQIPSLQLRLAEELKLLKEVGVHSINEMRSVYGSETIGPEGDDIYIEASRLPIGQDDQTEDNLKERRKSVVYDLKKAKFKDEEIIEYMREYEEISGKE